MHDDVLFNYYCDFIEDDSIDAETAQRVIAREAELRNMPFTELTEQLFQRYRTTYCNA